MSNNCLIDPEFVVRNLTNFTNGYLNDTHTIPMNTARLAAIYRDDGKLYYTILYIILLYIVYCLTIYIL